MSPARPTPSPSPGSPDRSRSSGSSPSAWRRSSSTGGARTSSRASRPRCEHPDLLTTIGRRATIEVAVLREDLEALQLEEQAHLAPGGPAQGEPLAFLPKDLARGSDLPGDP